MGINCPDFDEITYMTKNRCGDDLHNILQKHIEGWKKGKFTSLADRIVPIGGYPGVGKTCLLQYLADCYQGIYIDLEKTEKYGTSTGFINTILRKVEQAEKDRKSRRPFFIKRKPRLLLLIDHVPQVRLEEMILLEKRILDKRLINGDDFVIVAQRNKYKWGFDGDIPHPYTRSLRGVSLSGIKKIISENSWREGKRYLEYFGDAKTHIPLLAYWVCESEEISYALKNFIFYWAVRQFDGTLSSTIKSDGRKIKRDLNQLIGTFSYLDLSGEHIWEDWNTLGKALAAHGSFIQPQNLQKYLKKYGWLAYQNIDGETDENTSSMQLDWIEPMRQVLYVLLSKIKKDYYLSEDD